MNNNLRNTVNNAVQKLNEALCAVQSIETHLCFAGFGNIEPQVAVCNGDEIILEYLGREMLITEVIERMEEYGYITPNDF